MVKSLVLAATFTLVATAAGAQLAITEVVEGTASNFKYVEIHNGGSTAVNLASPQVSLRRYTNGATSPTSVNLTGTIPAGGFFLVANNQADLNTVYGSGVVTASQISTVVQHNGDDSYDLYDGTTVLDGFALDWVTGSDPGNPAADGVYFRVKAAYPNSGSFGNIGSASPIADGATSASGNWKRVAFTASNGGAAANTTPLAGGGVSGGELPVEVDAFEVE